MSEKGQPSYWDMIKTAFSDFGSDDAMSHGAAVAFYSALSLAPLLIIILWISSTLGEGTQQAVINQITSLVGPRGGEAIKNVVENAEERPDLGSFAGIFSILMLTLSATGVFGQLQHALNVIWEVEPKPGIGIRGWLRKRFLSLGMVATLGFLLLVSLAVSSMLQLLMESVGHSVPGGEVLWAIVNSTVSIIVFTLLFAAIFRFLPDAKIEWRDVWVGALITGILFEAGKFGLSIYLGGESVGSAYGLAGSFIALLLWVYYASLILFFGAELTQSWLKSHGRRIEPENYATRRDDEKRAKESPITDSAPA